MMFGEITNKLARVIEQKRLKTKLERDLHAVEKEYRQGSKQLESLGAELDQEKVDVDRLERTSLAALFYTILGSRDEQLEKERQELLSAQLQYQKTKHQVEYLDRERDRLRHQLELLRGVDDSYERLLSEKERILAESNQPVVDELISIAERIAHLNSEYKEVSEALSAGRDALAGLEQVVSSLESAKNWGTWDMIGGDFIATAVKHSRMDDARSAAHDVQTRLSQFKRELADVQENVDLHMDLSAFESFADYFLDGLIIDWIVQSKIVESLNQSQKMHQRISEAVADLEKLASSTRQQISDLQDKRTRIIEDA